jgi:calcium permeable stress-gated cation channel
MLTRWLHGCSSVLNIHVDPSVNADFSMSGFVILLVTRERVFAIGLRQAYHTIPLHASRLSSRVVLYLAVPAEGLRKENLPRWFGEKAVRSWVVSNQENLEKLVASRNSEIEHLEELELQLLKNANKDQSDGTRTPQHRPTQRTKYVVGDRVDSLDRARQKIKDILSEVGRLRQDDTTHSSRHTGAIFVEFKDQRSAHQACQLVQHPSPFTLQPRYVGVQPKEVLWQNLNLDPSLRITYSYLATALAVAIIIFWSIPVGIIGTISNINYLTDKVKFLRFVNNLPDPVLGLLTGFVPPFLLSTVVSYVPYFFKWIGNLSGQPTTSETSRWAQQWYFVFQVVQVFLITTVSSGAATVATKIANEPTSVPKLLAKNLPKSSNFYLTYFILQGLGAASKQVLNYSDLFSFMFYYHVMSKTPRQKFNTYTQMKGISWFNVYPKFTNLAVIAIAYSCVAPLILGFAGVGVYLFYLAYRYNLLYVVQVKTETHGHSYLRSLRHLMTGIYIAELCLIGLFGIKQAPGPSALSIILLVVTALYHFTVDKYLGPLEKHLPLDAFLDEDEDESRPLLGGDGDDDGPRTADLQRSRVHQLGSGKLPPVLLDPLAAFLEPHIFASQEALRPWLQDPENESEEIIRYTDEQVKNAFQNPAVTSKTPKVWLPKDRKKLSKSEVEANEKEGLPSTDDGAELSASNRIVWNPDDFNTVPIFKEPVRF